MMSDAAIEHLKVALGDLLSKLVFHVRMTPDASALIRAMCALALSPHNPNPNPNPNPDPLALTLTLTLTPTLTLTS